MNQPSIEERLLQLVYSTDYRPVKPRGISEQLHLDEEEYVELRRTIKRLSRSGQLSYLSNHLVAPIGKKKPSSQNVINGTFRLAYAGYGFVRPILDMPQVRKKMSSFQPSTAIPQ